MGRFYVVAPMVCDFNFKYFGVTIAELAVIAECLLVLLLVLICTILCPILFKKSYCDLSFGECPSSRSYWIRISEVCSPTGAAAA